MVVDASTLARSIDARQQDRKSTRLNSSHGSISYAVFCLKKKKDGLGARLRPLTLPKRKDTMRLANLLSSGVVRELMQPYGIKETYVNLHYFFFFNDTATTEIYTLSLHDALPICWPAWPSSRTWAPRASPCLHRRT